MNSKIGDFSHDVIAPGYCGEEEAEEYVYSSARDYMTGRKGLMRLEMW